MAHKHILVEIFTESNRLSHILDKLSSMPAGDVIIVNQSAEYEIVDGDYEGIWTRLICKMLPECATMLKMVDLEISTKMRISTIPVNLKDMFRE